VYRNFFKRLVDFVLSLIGLTLLSPIILILTVALYLLNSGKPFFLQKRAGKNEQVFTIIKFKTMNDKKDLDGRLLPDSERLTKIGRFVRKTSLDELPQLLNVLKGDMSLVGPRPLLVDYLNLYTPIQKRRHLIKPGITGWAQVNGRNAISWEEKFLLDVYYVDRFDFLLDCKILWLTLKNVIFSKGISSQGQATASRFEG
jgi:undecaprenyl phosphate N,N'-diacetylbacillosamine 1-phosphate transferase